MLQNKTLQTLTCEQRYKANKMADKVYEEWVKKYERESNENYQLTFDDILQGGVI